MRCKKWLLQIHIYAHMNLLNELPIREPLDFKNELLIRQNTDTRSNLSYIQQGVRPIFKHALLPYDATASSG